MSLFNLYYVDVLDGFSIIQLPVFTYAVLKISYCFYISFMKVLLSYSSTDCNLKGDLGNTPLMLACSLNNCEALSMLVCTRLHVVPLTYTLLQMITVASFCCSFASDKRPCLFVLPSHPFIYPSKLKHGAKLCQQNKLGHFAMHAAAFAGAKKAMEVILKAGMMKEKCYHQKLKVLTAMKMFFTRPSSILSW